MIACLNPAQSCMAHGERTGSLFISQVITSKVLWMHERAHQGKITALDWSADSQWLASGGRDGMIRIWNARTGERWCTFPHGRPVRQLRWAPDMRTIASTSDVRTRVWSLPPLPPAVQQ